MARLLWLGGALRLAVARLPWLGDVLWLAVSRSVDSEYIMIIDAHAHVYERLTGFGPKGEARAIGGGIVEWATGDKEQFLRPEHGDVGFSYDMLVSLMDDGGIDRAVLLQGSNYGFQNSYTAEAVRKYPTRFVGAGALDPFAANKEKIFENLVENLGFRILKFEMSRTYGLCGYHGGMLIDGDELAPILAEAERRSVTVTIDTGMIDTESFQIDGLRRARDRYPDLTLVVAHTLFPRPDGRNAERLGLLESLRGENVYYDVANCNLHIPEQRDYLRAAIDIVGADRIMWGTDCPGIFMKRSYSELVSDVRDASRFAPEEIDLILGGTAERVYWR